MDRISLSTPSRRAESAASLIRACVVSARFISWWPVMPLVALTNLTLWPALAHMAAVAEQPISQSSGWAPIARIRSCFDILSLSLVEDRKLTLAAAALTVIGRNAGER